MNPWQNIDLDRDDAATGIGHVIWFLMESGMMEAAAAVETEFGVSI